MKRNSVFCNAVLLLIVMTARVYACEPCAVALDFEQTVRQADLIIVGQKVLDGPRTDFGEGYGGPDWIDIEILEILKGEESKKRIKVNGWDAMCSYGIVIDKGEYIIFLKRRDVPDEDYQYDAGESEYDELPEFRHEESQDSSELVSGDIVKHEIFGRGRVVKIAPSSDTVHVNFNNVGMKKLALEYANLEKIEGYCR